MSPIAFCFACISCSLSAHASRAHVVPGVAHRTLTCSQPCSPHLKLIMHAINLQLVLGEQPAHHTASQFESVGDQKLLHAHTMRALYVQLPLLHPAPTQPSSQEGSRGAPPPEGPPPPPGDPLSLGQKLLNTGDASVMYWYHIYISMQ